MGINLVKGQKIDLTKGSSSLSSVMVGLGWDPVVKERKKRRIFRWTIRWWRCCWWHEIDCDASVLLLDEKGKLLSKENLVYFGNKSSKDGSVVHSGDNSTGDGDGDDEVINVNLSAIAPSVHKLVFVVNIYQARQRKQDFGLNSKCFHPTCR